jgi:hypothetical protein
MERSYDLAGGDVDELLRLKLIGVISIRMLFL